MSPAIESMPAPTPPRADPTSAPIGLARELALVAAGGMLGALARAALATRSGAALGIVPVSTQLVNAVGALVLGFLLATLEQGRPRPSLRPFLAVGVLGSFTTFSTLVDEGRAVAAAHSPPLALAFLSLSIAIGLLAFGLGQALGHRFMRRLGPGPGPDGSVPRRARDRSAA